MRKRSFALLIMLAPGANVPLWRDSSSHDSRFTVCATHSLPRDVAINRTVSFTCIFSDITRNSYIGYYEAATYDTATLRQHRNRIRRDVTDSEQPLILHLKTLDRWVPNESIFPYLDTHNELLFPFVRGVFRAKTQDRYRIWVWTSEKTVEISAISNTRF